MPFIIPIFACCVIILLITASILAVQLRNNRRLIREQLFFDPVTGGGNAAWFEQQAKKLIRQNPAGCYALVILDIDNFSILNETFGRAAGNQVLAHFYDVICGCLDSNERAARIASDNFALLVKNSDPTFLIQRLYDIVTLINDFNYQFEQKYFFFMCAGIYVLNDAKITFLSAMDFAQSACGKAREQTGAGLLRHMFFREEDHQRLMREKELENRIENALTNEDILVYLQPKYALQSKTIAGAEALVRWRDPENGIIPPSEFIYLFERNGFITALDLYVFKKVCQLMRRWLDAGHNLLPISVNLSRVHLSNPNFLDRFESIRQEYDIPPAYLEFELTETVVSQNPALLKEVIERMHALGYRCAMDDFGSGYSSLNLLKTIPMDVIKLDREFFLVDEETRARGELIVASLSELVWRLGMEIVAEGVETMEQAEALKKTHCGLAQAFLFGKPMPIPDFEALLRDQAALK